MAYSDDYLTDVFDRTDGRCHLCGKRLRFSAYGLHRESGCWEIEHSRAQALGGGTWFGNLYAACVSCNRAKCTRSTRAVRNWHGRRRAPMSRSQQLAARETNAIVGALAGGTIGGVCFGRQGFIVGVAIGLVIGYDQAPE
jgi:5-methylcytosine-specific restriction endonuclease McrA